jgi:hypothetical protein
MVMQLTAIPHLRWGVPPGTSAIAKVGRGEGEMVNTINIWINNYNRLTTTRALAAYFDDVSDCRVIVIDNASTYPPLLDWYRGCSYEVVRLEENLGHLAPWRTGLVRRRSKRGLYAVTDPDLDLTACPKDLLNVLELGLRRYPDRRKAGLGLEIGDLPACFPWRRKIRTHSARFWSSPLDDLFFDAPVDTTFALYRSGVSYLQDRRWSVKNCLRTNYPYIARHVPWYLDPRDLSEEERYYCEHANGSSNIAKCVREFGEPRSQRPRKRNLP